MGHQTLTTRSPSDRENARGGRPSRSPPQQETGMKECKTCGATKQPSDFYRHPQTKDKLSPKCKGCTKEAARANRKEKAEYYREYDRLRFKNDPKVKERQARYQKTRECHLRKRAWSDRNKEKVAAHIILNSAVRKGEIAKPSACEDCNQAKPPRQIHGHHEDYSQPLSVNWLCPQCHASRHRKERDNG